MFDRDDPPDLVTAAQAAVWLRKKPATIRKWVQRYKALQHGRHERAVYYDYADLAAIEACIHLGKPVPPTPEERQAA